MKTNEITKWKKAFLVILFVATFVGLFPISIRLADPFFTHAFRVGWQYEYPVLLVWPDHVEMRWFHNLAEISSSPQDAPYTFNVAPERQAWVEAKVRSTTAPNGADAGWIIHIKQRDASRQQIQLELLGNGITGIIYEARSHEIVPLQSRLAGPGGAFIILAVHVLLWGSCCLFVRFTFRLRARSQRKTLLDNLRH